MTRLIETTHDTPSVIPRHRGWLILLSVLAGLAVAVLWSAKLVDKEIGGTVMDTALGSDADAAISSGLAGIVFAFVSGLAGTFTACNVAAFSAVAPMLARDESVGTRLGTVLRPLGFVAIGAVVVSGVYGAIGALVGTGMPQLSAAKVGAVSARSVQAIVVFTVLGLIFVWLGLAAVKVLPDPLRRLSANGRMIFMGALIGAFLIGRPFGLFRKMFAYAATTHNPFYGASAFILQSLGNIVVMALIFLLLAYGTRGRFARWLVAVPSRAAAVTAGSFLVGGAFMIVYWGLRAGSKFGYWWFPQMPWNS
ncbi:hypothetical protein Lfu02_58250 [Longispora fulva]|uniref:Cytochrome C biogenesis protein transmembrane domain-containing protein n=1 Tax=Longispora fulva TaxID=619741 RepID=A0A8J7GB73_9ACTN|nr:hypothetical protein [Longispora fulva]MBG6137193.1 hypothetical protein [Longispora fulva]GIG61453.1 hypothetical protein Lfu02_58250 [Longispora fulva]